MGTVNLVEIESIENIYWVYIYWAIESIKNIYFIFIMYHIEQQYENFIYFK